MAFEIRPGRDVSDEIRRVAREAVDRAIEALQGAREGRSKGVHDARKRFKAIRALLRLAAPRLGPAFRRENRWYRDAARQLAGVREAQASLETLDRLGDPEDAALRRELEARYEARRGLQFEGTHSLAVLVADLEEAGERVAKWPLAGEGFEVIDSGLHATYRRGRRGFRRALRGSSATELHEWRKDVKYHRHHLELLVPLWPDVMTGAAATARRLGDLLGDHHDLHELRALLSRSPGLAGGSRERESVLASAERRSRELEARATAVGGLVYAERPGRFIARMGAYWDTHSGCRA
ncbi:MAG: CHAD domain-containing protein [Gammaproteobacteria bacterium]|nr:CHAD domain-containing protein [Gammaproteobacteria bacterium]